MVIVKKFVSVLTALMLTVSAYTVAIPFSVYASSDFAGAADRSAYLNASKNTQITLNFNEEIASSDADLKTAVTLTNADGIQVSGIASKVSADKKSVLVSIAGCDLEKNTEYTLKASGIKAIDNTVAPDVTAKVKTGAFADVYVYEDFEKYDKGVNWAESDSTVPSGWRASPMYSGAGLREIVDNYTDSESPRISTIDAAKNHTGNITNKAGKILYTGSLFTNINVGVANDPAGDNNNKVFVYEAGITDNDDGKLSLAFNTNVNIDAAGKKIVHSYKMYVPSTGLSRISSDWNDVKANNKLGSIGSAGSQFNDDAANIMFSGAAEEAKTTRYNYRGNEKINYNDITTNAWHDVRVVVDSGKVTKVIIDGNANNITTPYNTVSKYYGFVFGYGAVKAADTSVPSGKIYADDLISYELGNLTAYDGTTAVKSKFKPASDKIIVNFNNEVTADAVKNALAIKKGTETVTGITNVELTDHNTTAVITLPADLEANTAYTVSFASTLADIYGQALSNSEFAVNITTGNIPAAQTYLINDSFDGMSEGNWVGSGLPADEKSKWRVIGKANGEVGDELVASTLKYATGTGVKCGTAHGENLLGEAYIGYAKSPDNSGNMVFKYSTGYTNANDKHGYRVLRDISGADGYDIDVNKNIVAKYKVWFDSTDNAGDVITAVDNHQDIFGINTYKYGRNAAMGTRLVSSNGEPALAYNKFVGIQKITTGQWHEIAYVVTPVEPDFENPAATAGEAKAPTFSIYIDGKPVTENTALDVSRYADKDTSGKYPGGFYLSNGGNDTGKKVFGFNLNLYPKTGATHNGTVYFDDMQMLQPVSGFKLTTGLNGGTMSTKSPITLEFATPVASNQYLANSNEVKAFSKEFVKIVNASDNSVIGNPEVAISADGYSVTLDVSELSLKKSVKYKVVLDEDLRDEYYQKLELGATDLTFVPSNATNVYLSNEPTVTVNASGVSATINITNPTEEDKPVWYALAVYGDYNELIGIAIPNNNESFTLNAGATSADIALNIAGDFTTKAKKVKLFIWDSCENMDAYGPADTLWAK